MVAQGIAGTTAGLPKAVVWQGGELLLLDQRKLPLAEEICRCTRIEEVFHAIQTLAVRGAPAIGIAAAYGLLLGLRGLPSGSWWQAFNERCDYLVSARPTAVNLAWAVARMRRCVGQGAFDQGSAPDLDAVAARLEAEAKAIHQEDRDACRAIAEAGLPLVTKHPRLLTHCNAGSLAVSELGTALAPIYLAHQSGVKLHVFVDETRPLLQGARLTAYELHRSGVPCTLIADNMAAHFMAQGEVDAVLVGADRVVANGDTANKIGTLGLAVLAHHFGIPFYVALPTSTLDPATKTGASIVIEERAPEEVTSIAGAQVAPLGVPARSPAFDVTPAALITGLITDQGLLSQPLVESIAKMCHNGTCLEAS